ncbi:Lipooligosaccharide biosynthesis protein lex-1, partial [Haemophilus influenzae]
RKRH